MKTPRPATPIERALALLQDYYVMAGKENVVAAGPTRPPWWWQAPEADMFHTEEIVFADVWLAAKEHEWATNNRINRFGLVKVEPFAPPVPWTLRKIERSFPELELYDRLAALIALNGVLTEEDMEGQKNLIDVIERIVDQRVAHLSSQGRAIYVGHTEREAAKPVRRRRRVRDPKTGQLVAPAVLEARLRRSDR